MEVMGIAWVGNLYQKFEAVCLEVEEIMYQDTVKYVESQVQTIGESVKKICSEIMDDFLPPSSVNSENKAVTESPVEKKSVDGICNKSKGSKKEEPAGVDAEQVTQDFRLYADLDKDVSLASSFNGFDEADDFFTSFSGDIVRGECFDSSPRQNTDVKIKINSSLGINQSHDKRKISANKLMEETAQTEGSECWTSSYHELQSENHEAACDPESMVSNPTLVCVSGLDLAAENSNKIENAQEHASNVSAFNLAPKIMRVVHSAENLENKSDITEDTNEELSEGWGPNTIEFNLSSEGGPENVQAEKLKLYETCVIVNRKPPQFVPQEGSKQSHYKKRIRGAFSSRMKRRGEEYEQLAMWYGMNAVEESKNPPADLCESEWELV